MNSRFISLFQSEVRTLLLKTFVEICCLAFCHFLIYDWTSGLPHWLEALLFIGLPVTAIALMTRRAHPPTCACMPARFLFQLEVGRWRILVGYGQIFQPGERAQ
jgi:hypothetical protein